MLRIAISGAGMRSRTVWQRHVTELDGFELVGVQDPYPLSLEKSVEQGTIAASQGFERIEDMLDATRPDAVIVCPVHTAHAASATAALEHGAHVLVEKPFATEISDAVRITELAEAKGLLVGVVQNWRTKSTGGALKRALDEGMVGQVSHIFFRYLRDRELPHLPEYLFDEEDPMLYALTVHHVDLFRYVLGQEIVSVEGRDFHPPWSRYTHPSLMQLWLETAGGVAISYTGTISSRSNKPLPWESLIIEGELGSIVNSSDTFDPPLELSRRGEAPIDLTADTDVRDGPGQYVLADVALLRNFAAAISGDEALVAPARDNLGTLAVIDAIRVALRERRLVRVALPG